MMLWEVQTQEAFERLSAADQEAFMQQLVDTNIVGDVWEQLIELIDDEEINKVYYDILVFREQVFEILEGE